MDSGGYSAHSKNVEIKIDDYISYIKENINIIDFYANLDAIGNAAQSWKNQKYMEKQGLNPIPIFHCGEDFKWLKRYIDKGYQYIGLGGMVSGLKISVPVFLEMCWNRYLTDKEGFPIIKVHGFGMTVFKYIVKYPWYSVDSTSWLLAAGMGDIIVPITKNKKYDYSSQPIKIHMSGKSNKKQCFERLSPYIKSIILSYIQSKGFDVEKLINKYEDRQRLNAIYYKDLETYFPKWPWKLKKNLFYI